MYQYLDILTMFDLFVYVVHQSILSTRILHDINAQDSFAQPLERPE